jgi:TldD protein
MSALADSPADHVRIAAELLLRPAGLDVADLERVLSELCSGGVDHADVFLQRRISRDWLLEEGIVKSGTHAVDFGAGLRVVSGARAGFAFTECLEREDLREAARRARAAVARAAPGAAPRLRPHDERPDRYLGEDPLAGVASARQVALLRDLDRFARSLDPAVREVVVSLSGEWEVVLIARSDGRLVGDLRPLIRLDVRVIAERGGRREQGHGGGGGRFGLETLIARGLPERFAREAVRRALGNLEAVPAPAGEMTVVLGSGWPGVLLHEAVGHGLEGDFNRKGTSAYSGRIGERVAARGVSVVDDATLPGRRGSLAVDDEGTPTRCSVLIEDGVLRGYLQDLQNARLMGMTPTGNGRRESYAHLPMPRMTNTYMLPGPYHPEEIIASVERGIYAVNFGGGQVDITSGQFVFSANEAYLIEKGRIGPPIKGATLIGCGPEVLERVSMVGSDLALDEGVGVCGKDGQSVPVGVGQPTLKVDALTVGGTEGR